MWLQRTHLELSRIRRGKGHVIFFLLFFIVGFFYVNTSMAEYKRLQKEKSLFAPHPCSSLSLFSAGDSAVFYPHDTTTKNEPHITPLQMHGKLHWPVKKNDGDLVGLFFILGSVFMVYMGGTSYPSATHFFFFGNIFLRLSILLVFFLVPTVCMYYFTGTAGVSYSPAEGRMFFYFCLYLLVFLTFFYAAGVLLRVISRNSRTAYLYPALFWLGSIFVVPGLLSLFLQVRRLELPAPPPSPQAGPTEIAHFTAQVQGILNQYETTQLFYPSTFYHFLSEELTGRGLQSTSGMPRRYIPGVMVAIGYSFILLAGSFFILRRKQIYAGTMVPPAYQFLPGFSYHLLCRDETYKRQIVDYYRYVAGAAMLDNVRVEELDWGVDFLALAEYFINYNCTNDAEFERNIRVLGLSIPSLQTRQHYTQKEREEIILKIYAAVIMSGKSKWIVVNDFLKGKSRAMEQLFLKLVNQLNREGKTVVFLSCDLFMTALPFEGEIKNESFSCFRIDPRAVSLR